MEFLQSLTSEAIIVATIAITGFIKNKGWLLKIDTRLISLIVAVLLVLLSTYLNLSEQLVTLENALVIIAPAFGYDYLVNPIYTQVIQPIINLFKK